MKTNNMTRKAVFPPLYLLFLLFIVSCEYEQLHETINLNINNDKDGHIVSFEANLNLEGIFLWEFGDGNNSNLQNPTHVYNEMGLYEVRLSISREGAVVHDVSTTVIIDGIRDVEENLYSTARVGNQLWMTQNLMTKTCSDQTLLDPKHYQLGEDNITRYNFLAIEQCDICPEGWRLPTPTDLLNLREVGKTTSELQSLLNINEEGFGGFLGYMIFQDGKRLWYGDLGAYIERNVIAVTVDETEEDYSVARCIKVF